MHHQSMSVPKMKYATSICKHVCQYGPSRTIRPIPSSAHRSTVLGVGGIGPKSKQNVKWAISRHISLRRYINKHEMASSWSVLFGSNV